MTNVGELKKLAVKVGAASSVSEVTGNTVAEVINFINTNYPTDVIIKSSTASSTKKFKLQVVDNGTLSAVEVV